MSNFKILANFLNKPQTRLVVVAGARNLSFGNKASGIEADKVTHTGQKWASDDYRLARFVDKTKYVNTNFAIDLIDEIPPKCCTDRVVSCDGGGGPTGHPKVYINLDKPGNHSCGYCGLRFYLDQHHH